MASFSNRQTALRWMFLATGLLLLFGGNAIVQTVSENVAEAMYPDRPDLQKLLVNAWAVVNLSGATLSLITAWGMKRQKRWMRWCGIGASLLLLVLFPVGTLPGVIGLQQLISMPLEGSPEAAQGTSKMALARTSKDFWLAARYSRWHRLVLGLLGVAALISLSAVGSYARSRSMPGWNLGWLFLPVFLLADVTVHELGHVAVAWALKNRLRMVNIGPFTFCDFGLGNQVHFDWRRLFHAGGFVSSAPASDAHLRLKFIAELAGGPAAALLNALLMTTVFLALPGTRWQSGWWFPGFLAVIAFFDVIMNLIPLGYSDGSMIFHVTLLTRRGRALLIRCAAQRRREDAEALREQTQFAKAADLWTATLEKALEAGDGSAFLTALCHGHLARLRFAMGDWAGTEAASRSCLGFEAECASEDALTVNSWALIERAAFERHRVLEVGRAYARVVSALEERKGLIRDRVETCVTSIMLGCAHIAAADFQKALEEAGTALRDLPPGSERMTLRAEAWSVRAQAEWALGDAQGSLASANQAAALLRSPEIPPGQRYLAWHELALLGKDLFRQGESHIALQLVREAIENLEAADAFDTVAQHRIRLAALYRELGDWKQAWECLPGEDGLSLVRLRHLLLERARLQVAAGCPEAAVADCERLLPLSESEPLEAAVARSVLAQATLECGDHAKAASLARQAAGVLGSERHYERASSLITLTIAEWKSGGEWSESRVNEAQKLIQSDLLLRPAAIARLLEIHAERLIKCQVTRERERVPA